MFRCHRNLSVQCVLGRVDDRKFLRIRRSAMTRRRILGAALAVAAFTLTLGVPGPAHAKTTAEPGRHVLDGQEVFVHNLAGEMRIEEGSGSSVVVEITTGGRDGDRLTVDVRRDMKGNRVLHVVYPETKVVYREGGSGSNSQSQLQYNGRRYRVSSRGDGLDARADIRVLVPRGKIVHTENAVGRCFVTNVD